MNYLLFILPVLSALTGWIVCKLLLRMIFHPQDPKRILGFTFQGIIPAQRKAISQNLGKLAGIEFERSFNIEAKIGDPENLKKVMPMIEQHIDEFLRVKLKAEIPVIGMLIGDKTILSIKKVFLQEIEILFPEIMKAFAGNLKNDLNIEHMITERLQSVQLKDIEVKFNSMLGPRFRQIALVAALVGFLIGIAEALLLYFVSR